DQDAFRELVEPYRAELHVHCYRILGSVQDAEDALQETLIAAWRGLAGFEERASVRTWLYSVATNRALNMLRAARRRPQVEMPPDVSLPEPTRYAVPRRPVRERATDRRPRGALRGQGGDLARLRHGAAAASGTAAGGADPARR